MMKKTLKPRQLLEKVNESITDPNATTSKTTNLYVFGEFFFVTQKVPKNPQKTSPISTVFNNFHIAHWCILKITVPEAV